MGLDLAIIKNFQSEEPEDCEPTDISFDIDQWAAFFFEELKVHRPPYTGGDRTHYMRHAEKAFVAALSDFPMLARIEDFYSDADYDSHEVHKLVAECNSILPTLANPLAIQFAEGLIAGCKKAIETKSGISLGAD